MRKKKKLVPSPNNENLLPIDGGRQRTDIPSKNQEIEGCYENIFLFNNIGENSLCSFNKYLLGEQYNDEHCVC